MQIGSLSKRFNGIKICMRLWFGNIFGYYVSKLDFGSIWEDKQRCQCQHEPTTSWGT